MGLHARRTLRKIVAVAPIRVAVDHDQPALELTRPDLRCARAVQQHRRGAERVAEIRLVLGVPRRNSV